MDHFSLDCPLGSQSPQCGCQALTLGCTTVVIRLYNRNIQYYFLFILDYWANGFVYRCKGNILIYSFTKVSPFGGAEI